MPDVETNLLDLIPARKIQFEESGDGLITLLKPKFKNKFLVKYLLPRIKKPNFRIKLDTFGSFVWKQCDGNNSVEQIGNLLQSHFKEDIEPVYDRLALFMQSLVKYKFITYKAVEN
jgi:hypothetical protein